MENRIQLRRYTPIALWAVIIFAIYFAFNTLIAPHADGISLTPKIMANTLQEITTFLVGIFVGLILIEVYAYQFFFRQPRDLTTAIVTRTLQGLIALFILMTVTSFFEITDLFRMGEGVIAKFFRLPLTIFDGLKTSMIKSGVASKNSASLITSGIFVVIFIVILVAIHYFSKPRHNRMGLAYLLILPAFIGVLFLIIYPFLFEIKLAFSNASLGTQATKNASYGLVYGWENLKTLFTGNVAKDAKFFDVFIRTILWTVINVTFHVGGGMTLALLLNRPMKLQGLYRTLLVFPWAIPTTIAAMSLRNEFDPRYGMFNIILGNLQNWFLEVSQKITLLAGSFGWLAQHVGPVPWKQDPFWAFVSVLIANIWLGIPFMSVIILGGLQSISREYYEAAEIDGANNFQQFRNITLPLLRPVLTPAIVLGVVWTFNKFDIIYLITQGGPQEKTDILVSSMYKAAFQFYRYGFTAMFALVIFIFLLLFTLFYLRITGGLKGAAE
jgi:arabinogalactan oligomer/maltooligosaccharide transport system permease protein